MKIRGSKLVLALVAGVFFLEILAAPTRGDDWPQWQGPQRDGVWRETGIVDTFPAGGPKVLWRTAIGAGFAGPSVAQGKVFVADRINTPGAEQSSDKIERVLCLNEADGKLLWKQEYPCSYQGMQYSAGPRAAPTVAQGKVYALGAAGNFHCYEAATGKELWAHDFNKEYHRSTPLWGYAGHPLVDGQKVICLVGGQGATVVAFDKDTGKELWHALSAREPGYCTPALIEAGGARQLIVWHPQALNSINPDTGEVYWSIPFEVKAALALATPRKMGDQLFITSFYNGPLMVRLDAHKPTATVAWRGESNNERRTDKLHGLICTPFLEDGHIYGACSYGQLRCLKADTGERVWETFQATTEKEVRWGTVFIVKNDQRFFLWNERGDLIIARLTPKGYDELSRAHLLDPLNTNPGRPVLWSHPAFANRSVYVRNDAEIIRVSLAK